MPSTTSYDFGDVVLVSFPFTNLKAAKKRPAVIISSPIYEEGRPDVILMAITSRIRNELMSGEVMLQDWKDAGLVKPSMLKPLIATLARDLIAKVMGKLSDSDRDALDSLLQRIIGP